MDINSELTFAPQFRKLAPLKPANTVPIKPSTEMIIHSPRREAGCPSEPHPDRLVFMPRDLFRHPQAASSHHDQQRLRYLRSIRLQAIHRRAFGFPKVGLAVAAAIALLTSMAPIAH